VHEVVLRRATWLPMLAMFTAVASTVVLRPILAAHLVADEGKSVLTSAILFSIMSVCAIIADMAVTALDLAHLSRHSMIIFGLAMASLGFHLLRNPRYLYLAVVLVAVGANGSLVLTLGHLAEQSGMEQQGQHDVATFIAFMVFAFGEAVGLVVSGIFRDWLGSFAASMVAWSKLVLLVAVIMSLDLILGMTWSVLGYGNFARMTRNVERDDNDETHPLLG
jgi:MFS family permease